MAMQRAGLMSLVVRLSASDDRRTDKLCPLSEPQLARARNLLDIYGEPKVGKSLFMLHDAHCNPADVDLYLQVLETHKVVEVHTLEEYHVLDRATVYCIRVFHTGLWESPIVCPEIVLTRQIEKDLEVYGPARTTAWRSKLRR